MILTAKMTVEKIAASSMNSGIKRERILPMMNKTMQMMMTAVSITANTPSMVPIPYSKGNSS